MKLPCDMSSQKLQDDALCERLNSCLGFSKQSGGASSPVRGLQVTDVRNSDYCVHFAVAAGGNPLIKFMIHKKVKGPRVVWECEASRLTAAKAKLAIYVTQRLENAELPEISYEMQMAKDGWRHGGPFADLWREFLFYDYQENRLSETFMGQIVMDSSALIVRHGEIECQFSHFFIPCPNIFAFEKRADTWERSVFDNHYISNIDDHDVISGASSTKATRLLEAISESVRSQNPVPKALIFLNSCVPIMTADDIEPAVEKFSRETGIPYIIDNMQKPPLEGISFMLTSLAGTKKVDTDTEIQKHFNLIGFPEIEGLQEVVGILESSGAHLNMKLLPSVSCLAQSSLSRAHLNVFMKNPEATKLVEHLLPESAASIHAGAPYGIRDTRDWILMIAEALGRDVLRCARVEVKRRIDLLEETWKLLTSRAGKHRLGIITGPDDIRRLQEPKLNNGAPVLYLLGEMGFKLNIVFYAPEANHLSIAEQDMLNETLGNENIEIIPFRSREDLHHIINSAQFETVITNVVYDRRLMRAGKNWLSPACFQMGFCGAINNLQRILSICENPFPKAYGRYVYDEVMQ